MLNEQSNCDDRAAGPLECAAILDPAQRPTDWLPARKLEKKHKTVHDDSLQIALRK
jgi:hypothetical protein